MTRNRHGAQGCPSPTTVIGLQTMHDQRQPNQRQCWRIRGRKSFSFCRGLVRVSCKPKLSLCRNNCPERNQSKWKWRKYRATKLSLDPLDPTPPEARLLSNSLVWSPNSLLDKIIWALVSLMSRNQNYATSLISTQKGHVTPCQSHPLPQPKSATLLKPIP